LSALPMMDRSAFRLLIRRVGRVFLAGSIIAWALLGITGVAMASDRLHSSDELTATGYGRTVLAKTSLFIIAIILTIVHTIAGARTTPLATKISRTFSPVIFLLTLAIFYLAVRLTEG
jgi:putative copper export protein